MKPARNNAALTVLEVLVSLAIFALAVVALSAAYVNALGAHRAIAEQERDAGDWRQVRAMVLTEPELDKAARDGKLQLTPDRQITWAVAVRPGHVTDLFEVVLTGEVRETGLPPRPHHERFRVLRPSWTAPGDSSDAAARIQETRR